MTRKFDTHDTDLPRTVRPRVRLPEPFAPARVFQGWGPDLGR
jgi:hypothetical protein